MISTNIMENIEKKRKKEKRNCGHTWLDNGKNLLGPVEAGQSSDSRRTRTSTHAHMALHMKGLYHSRGNDKD